MNISKQALFWLSALGALLIILVIVLLPKQLTQEGEETVTRCSCLGSDFWYGTRCVGFTYNCTQVKKASTTTTCEEYSCQTIIERVREQSKDESATDDLLAGAGLSTDVILVIDSSNSMEGDRLLAAKQAALRLVDNIAPGERIGIVSFSESSTIVHNFSDDKRSLTAGVMAITVSGGTNYLPALAAAERLFQEQPREARRGIIFLSDGVPSDDPDAIVDKAQALQKEQGITLFTINFGIEEGSSERNILQEMIRDDDPQAARRWYRAFTDTQSIANAFYEAWQEIANLDIITIIPTYDDEVFTGESLEMLAVRVLLGNALISGDSHEDALCVPQLRVVLHAEDLMTGEVKNISLESSGYAYRAPSLALSEGEYAVRADASLVSNHEGTCLFSGAAELGNITVIDSVDACASVSCEQAQSYLVDYDLAAQASSSFPRSEGPGRVAILLDASESMRFHTLEVYRSVERINHLLDQGDERALITFADTARLAVPLTRDEDSFSRALEEVRPQGTTRMVPALQKAQQLFSKDKSDRDVVVIITDGMSYDVEGSEGVLEAARLLVDEDVCLFVIGYGTDLLRHEETLSLLRSISDYSRRRLGCGGYTYTPESDELSLLVTEMFGGKASGNESIMIITEFGSRQALFTDELRVRARVVSATTGLHVPTATATACLPAATLDMVLRTPRGEEVASIDALPRADGTYEASVKHLLPGPYVLSMRASLPISGCNISTERSEEFVVIGVVGSASEGVVMAGIVALSILLVVVAGRARRALSQAEKK